MDIIAYVVIFRGERAHPCTPKSPIQEGLRISAGRGYQPPAGAALLTSISLALRQGTLST
jgi:hypothetical protein